MLQEVQVSKAASSSLRQPRVRDQLFQCVPPVWIRMHRTTQEVQQGERQCGVVLIAGQYCLQMRRGECAITRRAETRQEMCVARVRRVRDLPRLHSSHRDRQRQTWRETQTHQRDVRKERKRGGCNVTHATIDTLSPITSRERREGLTEGPHVRCSGRVRRDPVHGRSGATTTWRR